MTDSMVETGAMVETGTKVLTLKTTSGDVLVETTGRTGTVDLTGEGTVEVVDLTSKKQKDRKLKMEETLDKGIPVHPTFCAFSGEAKKYFFLLECVGKDCDAVVRKYTSDVHQSHYCDKCSRGAKKAKAKAKRAEK